VAKRSVPGKQRKPYEISVSTWASAKRVPPQYGRITAVETCSFGVSLCSIAM